MNFLAQPHDREHALKCELAGEVLRSSGRLRLQVTGWSMLPSIWPGDTLILESAITGDVSEGDIVLFSRDCRLFAHRVVRAVEQGLLTRGDAMPQADPPVAENELLGRVACIVRNGECVEPIRNLRLSHRAVAGLVRSSKVGARAVVGIHGMFQNKVVQS